MLNLELKQHAKYHVTVFNLGPPLVEGVYMHMNDKSLESQYMHTLKKSIISAVHILLRNSFRQTCVDTVLVCTEVCRLVEGLMES